tara:strand:+ start:225 stop:1475 length:1251 start_codon:yes stop_codon:yes gene_type:complete
MSTSKFKTFNSSKFGRPFERVRELPEQPEEDGPVDFTNPNTRARFITVTDYSDAYAARGFTINFKNTITDEVFGFKAFITAYNETFNCDWAEERVYGRADPIPMWKSNTRKITLAFKIPSFSKSEGYENLNRLQTLIKSLYPSYASVGNASTIAQSPLIRMGLMNLLGDNESYRGYAYEALIDPGGVGGYFEPALGYINNMSVNHNLETSEGGVLELNNFNAPSEMDIDAGTEAAVVPKVIDVNLDFTVIHEDFLGWSKTEHFGDTWVFGGPSVTEDPESGWPYGVSLHGTANPTYEEIDDRNNFNAAMANTLAGIEEATRQQEENRAARYSGLLGGFRESRDERVASRRALRSGVPTEAQLAEQVATNELWSTIRDAQESLNRAADNQIYHEAYIRPDSGQAQMTEEDEELYYLF